MTMITITIQGEDFYGKPLDVTIVFHSDRALEIIEKALADMGLRPETRVSVTDNKGAAASV